MATIGLDCEIVLDGVGYFVKPGSYRMQYPRVRSMATRADGGLAYVDMGPGKRIWTMVILCVNDLLRYDGAAASLSGQQYRDALQASFLQATGQQIFYIDPLNNVPVAVHFDRYEERVPNLHIQQRALATGGVLALSYEVTIELIEA